MNRFRLLSCAVLICLQFSNAQQKDASAKNAPHISPEDQKFVDIEKTLWDAWKNKDQKPSEDLLSDKFFEVDVTGTYDKSTEISEMDKCDLKDYAILNPQVRHLTDGTVLLTYKATIHDICEGEPVPEHQTINILFVREKGKWLKVLDSEVPLSTTSSKSEREIIELERASTQAEVRKDKAWFDQHLAEEYLSVHGDGRLATKQEDIQSLTDPDDKKESEIADDMSVRIYGNTAFVTGRNTETGTDHGRRYERQQSRWTDLLVKRNGQWLWVANTWALIPSESAVTIPNALQQRAESAVIVSADEKEIRRVQDLLIDAYLHHHYAVLDQVLADDYTHIDDDGLVLTKKQVLDEFNSGDDKISSYNRQDERLRMFGETATLTYRYQFEETYKGHEVGGDMRMTRIFAKRDERWVMVAGQDTRVNPQPDFTSFKSNDELTLKRLEQDWLDAYREGDADKMSKILGDDFIGRWGDGSTTDKTETVEPVRTGQDRHSSNHLDECNVRIYGNTAIVTGTQTEQSTLSGREGSGTYSYTDVFLKRHGHWQVVASETKRVAGRSVRERLIGSWKEVSSEETLADGSVVRLDEIGLLTYDASGHMSGQAMRRSEPTQKIPSDSTYQSNGYDAYFGTFTVDEEKHTVTHHVQGGVARPLVGKDLVRSYSFDDDRLIMKPANSDENWKVVFEKNKTY